MGYTSPMAKIYNCIFVLSMAFYLVHGETGTATINSPPYVPSACDGFTEEGTMIASASEPIFQNGDACGAQYSVTCLSATNLGDTHPCTGESVVVTITDKCPSPGCQGDLDIAQEAFVIIADPAAGKVNVEYHRV